MDNHFLGLLWASASLGGALREELTRQQTPMDVLAAAVVMDARGAYDEQVHAAITPQWRPHIEIIHAERRVYSDGRQIAGPPDAAPPTQGRADSAAADGDPLGASGPTASRRTNRRRVACRD